MVSAMRFPQITFTDSEVKIRFHSNKPTGGTEKNNRYLL